MSTHRLGSKRQGSINPPVFFSLRAATRENLPSQACAGLIVGVVTSGGPGGFIPRPSDGLQLGGFTIGYMPLLGIVGLLALLALLVLFSLLTNRTRAQRKRVLQLELAEAERRATIEAERIAEMEAAQRTWAQAPASPEQHATLQTEPENHGQPKTNLRCPRCGESVVPDANYCTNCRLLLSPTESGLHLRVRPGAAATPAPVASVRSIAEQPTLIPASSIAEQPTLIEAEDEAEEAIEPAGDLEKTVPYGLSQVQGNHLGFVAGMRSDPGIKRKYKPNEDSLFAAQGMLNGSSVPTLFGLFVVADGMGGHANGEDASRLAIQTLIDYVLPRLLKGASFTNDAYVQLLVEGIQQANLAVHQNNMQQRGDMGTTVTAAMVVDTTAYVANVGDSRTYLYREAEGLKKVTNDHSVVASLVEAGIIKPDDIYTHPKRNQIYRSLGEKAAVEIDSFTVQLQEGDKLLLCSDGLWDMVRDPRIEELIKNPAPNPSTTGDALIQEALASGGEDNVSVIVVHITEAAGATGVPRIQLLAKPDAVQMPPL